jgi:hypothetical protein
MDATVLLVMDADPEVRRVLTDKVFPRQADALTVAQWEDQPGPPAG